MYDITAGSRENIGNTTGSSNGNGANMAGLPGTNYTVMAWSESGGFKCRIAERDTGTGELSVVGSQIVVDANAQENNIWVVPIDGTYFAIFWAGTASDGFCRLYSQSSGTITALGSAVEYDTTNGTGPCGVLMDSTHILNVWTGAAGDGFAQIFTVDTGAGTITATGTPYEFDTSNAVGSTVVKISSTKALVVWRGDSSYTYAMVLDINTSTWAVTAAASRTTIRATACANCEVSLLSSTLAVVIIGQDGSYPTHDFLYAIAIVINNSTWAITVPGSAYELQDGGDSSSTNFITEFLTRQRGFTVDSTHWFWPYFNPLGQSGAEVDRVDGRVLEVDASDGSFTVTSTGDIGGTTNYYRKVAVAIQTQSASSLAGILFRQDSDNSNQAQIQPFAIALAAPGPANVKTVGGLAIESVKTMGGLPIESVKTIGGLN